MNKIDANSCNSCGEHWDCATFLSESFNFSGGNMVFQCQCGNTITRYFVQLDMLKEEVRIDYLLEQSGLDKDMIPIAKANYKKIQVDKKLKELKF